jgi:hypothetical protein
MTRSDYLEQYRAIVEPGLKGLADHINHDRPGEARDALAELQRQVQHLDDVFRNSGAA